MNRPFEQLPTSLGERVSIALQSFQPSLEIALRSLRHVPTKIKGNFSENEHAKKIAMGYWYEAVIYERLLELAKQDADYHVVAKWNDAPWQKRKKPKLGQDGLFYDESGAIVARGNGQDLENST